MYHSLAPGDDDLRESQRSSRRRRVLREGRVCDDAEGFHYDRPFASHHADSAGGSAAANCWDGARSREIWTARSAGTGATENVLMERLVNVSVVDGNVIVTAIVVYAQEHWAERRDWVRRTNAYSQSVALVLEWIVGELLPVRCYRKLRDHDKGTAGKNRVLCKGGKRGEPFV